MHTFIIVIYMKPFMQMKTINIVLKQHFKSQRMRETEAIQWLLHSHTTPPRQSLEQRVALT